MHAQLQHAHKASHTSAGPVSAQQHRDVRAAARNKSGQYRQQQQDNSSQRSTDYEQLIAPVSTTDVSTVADVQYAGLPDYVAQVQLSRSSSSSKGGRPGKPTSTRHDGRRGSLVKIRVPPRRYRLRQGFDSAQTLHIKPSDPEFVGRLTSEINSVYGPRRLGKIIQDFSEHFTTEHAAAAVSQLAGMVTGKDISPEQLSSMYKGPAAKVARVFEAKVQEATLKDCAKVIYSLARLQLHMPQLLSAVEQVTTGQLRRATPQALAGLAVGLAHWGCRPSEAWIRELCMESFAAIDGFSAQDLANLLFSLAVWKVSVSQPFLQRCLTAFRGHFGAAATTPAAMVRFLYALTQLPACQDLPPKLVEAQPAGAPVYIHHDDYRHQRELHTLSGVMGLDLDAAAAVANRGAAASAAASAAAVGDPNQPQRQQRQQQPLQPQQPQQPQQPPMSAVNNSSGQSSSRAGNSGTAVATYRLPSFNWLTACLSECRRLIDRFKPAELSTLLWSCACLNHAPDLIFMEAWYRASAVRMHAFTPATLAAAVQALGMLQPGKDVPGAVSGRWLQLVLNHSQQMMQQQQQGYPQTAPPAAAAGGDSEDNEQQQQQQQQQLFSASDLSKLLWGLAELKIWPGKPWMDAWLQACGSQLTSATPSDLSDITWALSRLRFSPDDSWMTQLSTVISKQLQGFSVQGLAVVIWGYTRLGFRPDRLWLLRFRAVAGSGPEEGPASSSSGGSSSSSSSGQQLAQFVAAFLAQQNRQRFAEGRPPGKAAAVAAPAAAGGGRGAGRGRGRGRGSGGHNRQLG